MVLQSPCQRLQWFAMVYQWSCHGLPWFTMVYNGLQWFANGLPSDTNGIPMVYQLSRTIGQTME